LLNLKNKTFQKSFLDVANWNSNFPLRLEKFPSRKKLTHQRTEGGKMCRVKTKNCYWQFVRICALSERIEELACVSAFNSKKTKIAVTFITHF
jgi:hypothetical protein